MREGERYITECGRRETTYFWGCFAEQVGT
jgi:hypothetical protein